MATQAAERQANHTLGFQTLEEEVHVDSLPVQGAIPPWLSGDLTRVTPALLDVGGVPLRHWFDGLAMLNAFRIGEGKVGYASRFLRSEALKSARKGRFEAWGFGQDPCRSLFGRMTAAFSAPDNDNANVNLSRIGDRYIAMTEMPVPMEFDRDTLNTVGPVKWDDRVGGAVGSAHPHHDRVADELISYVVEFSARNAYKIFAVPGGSSTRRLIAKIPAGREPSYIHSMAMTEHHLLLVAWPAVVDPLRMIRKGGSFMHNMSWKPERGTTFHVVDRHSGEHVATGEGEAFFCFHHINAYERGDEVVVDLCAYEDPSVIRALELSKAEGRHDAAAAFLPHALPGPAERRPGDWRAPVRRAARAPAHRLRTPQRAPVPLRVRRRLGRLAGPRRQARRAVGRDAALGAGRLLPGRAGVRATCRGRRRGRRRAPVPRARRREGALVPGGSRRGHTRGAGPRRGPARDPVRLPRAVLLMRASDAERDAVVDALRGHAAEGRLDLAELEQRVAWALEARTHDELGRLTADLPRRQPRPQRPRAAELRAYVGVIALLTVIWAVTGADYFWPMWPMLGWGVPLALGRRGGPLDCRRHELARLRPGSA